MFPERRVPRVVQVEMRRHCAREGIEGRVGLDNTAIGMTLERGSTVGQVRRLVRLGGKQTFLQLDQVASCDFHLPPRESDVLVSREQSHEP